MHAILIPGWLFVSLLVSGYTSKDPGVENSRRYISLSRFTDPQEYAALLDDLPEDAPGIVSVVSRHMVRLDAQGRASVEREQAKSACRRVWPPRLADILKVLKKKAPHNLRDDRNPNRRVAGSDILRSYFLAGLLRYRLIPARVRAGYLKDASPAGPPAPAPGERPDGDSRSTREFGGDSARYTGHWACECWDRAKTRWQLLDVEAWKHDDANMPATSRLQFEYAAATWQKMRRDDKICLLQVDAGLPDHRAHIRAQLLNDFASLLNHDLAGCDDFSGKTRSFLENKKYADLSVRELQELDRLAELLLHDPNVEELVGLYRKSPGLRMESAENDPYSYIFQ